MCGWQCQCGVYISSRSCVDNNGMNEFAACLLVEYNGVIDT